MTYDKKRQKLLIAQLSLAAIGILSMFISDKIFEVAEVLYLVAYAGLILPVYRAIFKERIEGMKPIGLEVKFYREQVLDAVYRLIFVVVSIPVVVKTFMILIAFIEGQESKVEQATYNLPFYLGLIMLTLSFGFVFRGVVTREGILLANDCFLWEDIESYYCVRNKVLSQYEIYVVMFKMKSNSRFSKVKRMTIGKQEKEILLNLLEQHKVSGRVQ